MTLRIVILSLFVTAALLAAAAPGAQAQTTDSSPFLEVQTEGSGPSERVARFVFSPQARQYRTPDAALSAIADAIAAGGEARVRAAAFESSKDLYVDLFGGGKAIGTFLEHGAGVGGFGLLNTIMTWVGLVVAAESAASEFVENRDAAFFSETARGLLDFTTGLYGSSALQVAGISLFVFEVTLRRWHGATIAAGMDNWRPAYQAFYRERERSKNDWKRRLWEIHLLAERRNLDDVQGQAQTFRVYLDAEINTYVNRAFQAEMALYWERGFAGLGATGDQRRIQEALVAEHKLALEAMIARDILPEIAERARNRTLQRILDRHNDAIRPLLNEEIELSVTAWGVPEGRVSFMAGETDWGGALGADGTFSLTMTRLAYLRAGLPTSVALETPDGRQEREVALIDDQLIATFGTPPAPLVTRYRLTERGGHCRFVMRTGDRSQVISVQIRDLPPQQPVLMDFVTLDTGLIIAGRYDADANNWRDASPGVWRENGTVLKFGPPRIDGLSEMHNCSLGFFTSQGDVLAGQCRFVNHQERPWAGGRLLERRCESTGEIAITGVFADMGDGMSWHAMDGAEGAMISEIMRQSMKEGIPGFDPSQLEGLVPGGLPPGLMTTPRSTP